MRMSLSSLAAPISLMEGYNQWRPRAGGERPPRPRPPRRRRGEREGIERGYPEVERVHGA